ncbi:MAG: hypothetical protein KAJ19_10205, partial [Gammaproteobacteria bacterium]|nr:hypothetical protein [Gammaproteobacteria bacterium]
MARAGKKAKVSLLSCAVILVSAAILLTASCTRPKGVTIDDKRDYARDMRDKTLQELYEKKPEAKAKV